MTTHNIQDQDCEIATPSNMVFDEESFLDSIPGNSPTMNTTNTKYTSRLVSQTFDLKKVIAECYATTPFATPIATPIATHVTPCNSEESDPLSAATSSVTGEFRDIERKYYIDSRVLGTGHYGTVKECIDRVTGQRYAVKTICKSDPGVKPGGLTREIMLLREMKHRSIVQLVDVFEDAEYMHLVTGICNGGELFDKIVGKSSSDNGAPCFAEDEAAKIVYQILTAVSYMHKHDIAHRDIKPENILFETEDEDSPIKIIDFGLARKHFGSLGKPPMTTIVGTPYYIAPEVLRKKYDKSCDLWSVGVVAYILLCGYPPFNGANNDETRRSILRGRYSFPSQDWKGTSREARDFIRLLLLNPSKRMTVEQSLNHPWIAKHANTDAAMMEEERQDRSSTDVVVKGLRISRKGSMLCGRISKRKMRKSMFGI